MYFQRPSSVLSLSFSHLSSKVLWVSPHRFRFLEYSLLPFRSPFYSLGHTVPALLCALGLTSTFLLLHYIYLA